MNMIGPTIGFLLIVVCSHLLAISFSGTLFQRVGFNGALESATIGLQITDEYPTPDTLRRKLQIEYSPTRFERDPFVELSVSNFDWARLFGDFSFSPWNGITIQFRIPLWVPVMLLAFVTTRINPIRSPKAVHSDT
jgi:hypothetical protein